MSQHRESELCPVFACTLTLGEHEGVTEPWVDCAPGSVWHTDSSTGVHWPAPDGLTLWEEEPDLELPPERTYTVYDEQQQREHRERTLSWARPDWISSLEDMVFIHRMMGAEIPFSGDLRPTAANRGTGGAEHGNQ